MTMSNNEKAGRAEPAGTGAGGSEGEAPRTPSPEALRALAEAEERRRQRETSPPPTEQGGRPGPDPVRYGDWENGGIASDF